MEYTLVYLDRKSHCLCYLVSDDSEATVYLRMFEYITYVYVSLHLSIYLSREDIWNKCGKMLTIGQFRWRIYGSSFYYFCNSSVSVKLFQDKKLNNSKGYFASRISKAEGWEQQVVRVKQELPSPAGRGGVAQRFWNATWQFVFKNLKNIHNC